MHGFNRHVQVAKGALLLVLIAGGALAAPQVQPAVIGENAGGTRAIQGKVISKEGAPVPGAIIQLKNMKTLQVRSYIAQNDGRYHFFGLSVDVNYQLRAEWNGLASKAKTVSVFDSHKLITVDLKLVKKLKT
jgi:hypothetical protein